MFLRISNPGVSPVEGFTHLGVSTSRGNEKLIGQFGSGSAYGTNVLLRNDITPIVFCGNKKLEYFTRPLTVSKDGNLYEFNSVCVKISGEGTTRTKELNITLEHGVIDWTQVAMGLREYVSNAIDGAVSSGGSHKDVVIDVVDKPRAKAGTTQVFVPLTPEVDKFRKELSRRFLHFGLSWQLETKVLPAGGRNLTDKKGPVIYKKGVYVRESQWETKRSLFDYNLGDELELDESRNVDDYSVRSAVAKTLAQAEPETLREVFVALANGEDVWEADIDSYYLSGNNIYDDELKREIAKKWQLAFNSAFGELGVACGDTLHVADFVCRKGFSPVQIKSEGWLKALKKWEVRNETAVLNDMERAGREEFDAPDGAEKVLDRVWEVIEMTGLTCGKEKPKLKMFQEIMKGESQVLGTCKSDGIYMHKDLLMADAITPLAFKVCMEECAHWCSQSNDMSRDFQDYLLRMITELTFSH